jgi:putative zinc finger/helix-turn-helix YgiT family protein
MNSPITGKPMNFHTEVQTLNFRKEEFTVRQRFYLCEETGERFTTTALDELNLSLVYNAYRAKHHIPTPVEIKETREKYGISAVKMSEILGFGQNSYGLYERGEIPNLSNAKLLKLAADLESFQQLVNDWETEENKQKDSLLHRIGRLIQEEDHKNDSLEIYLSGEKRMSELTGFRKPSLIKLKEMIVYFAHEIPSYKTKMNKLLFYADFAYFRDYGVSISGTKYKAIPYGPVPNMNETIFENMAETDVIDIFFESKENGSKKEKLVGRSDRPFDPSLFPPEELQYLEKVANQFSKTTPNEIVEISHKELAWIENERNKNFISYEFALELKAV